MTNIDHIKKLLGKYNQKKSTSEEKVLIESWFLTWQDEKTAPKSAEIEKVKQEIWESLPVNRVAQPNIFNKLNLLTAAAVLLIISGIGIYLLSIKRHTSTSTPLTYKTDIPPGKNQAMLILANGSMISLSDASTGNISNPSGTNIIKEADGAVVYSTRTKETPKIPEYNIIKIPNGGQYKIKLSDGTNVWLNSASTLKFPVSFQRLKERTVELEGEGYFEVAKDKNRPFKVITTKQEIEVLGTHFNVSNYPDEPDLKTTLIEGLVRLTLKTQKDLNKKIVLRPGEQSVVGKTAIIVPADTESILAWKSGNFIFKDQELNVSMRQIERWYDVEVVYNQDAPKTIKIGGSISKDNPISKILSDMEVTGKVKFKLEGRRITVSKS